MAVVFWLDDQGRPAARGAPAQRGQARVAVGHAGAAEEHPGLALLALLLLRVRRLRGARAVAAALPDRRLRPRHHHRRHDRRRLLGPGEPVPRLWRRAVRQVRRAPHHVLDVRRLGRLLLRPVLSADRVRRAGHSRADELPAGDRPRRLHRDRLRARLLHEPRQGRGLQAHPGLLPAARRLGRRRRRPGRRARRLRPADPVRRAERSDGRVAELLHGAVRPLGAGAGVDASRRSAPWRRASTARSSRSFPSCPRCRRSTSPSMSACSGPHLIEDWRPEDKDVLAVDRPQARAAQPADLDPVAAAVVRRVDGVVGGRGEAACDRLHLHDRPAVLAGGAARPVGRDAAHLLLLHGADLRRPAVDHADHLVADHPGARHRHGRAEPGDALLAVPGARAAVRLRRRQLRLLDGQHLVLLPQGGEGQRARAQCRARQSRRQRRAVRGAARHHRRRVRLARRRAA